MRAQGKEILSKECPLLFTIDGGIATITLNRPQRGNSLDPALINDLPRVWHQVNEDDSIRCAIITGAGERHFCTGADVGALQVGVGGLQNQPYAVANRFSPRMANVRKPVICVVNGLVNGGGLHFVTDSDIVISVEAAQFMDSHVSVGQVSGLESQGVARRAGLGAALILALTGTDYRMSAQRAYALGLVDILAEDKTSAMQSARKIAGMICNNSPRATELTKRAIWAVSEMAEPASNEYGWELLKSHWSHPDFAEGPAAYEDERDPAWNCDANARR